MKALTHFRIESVPEDGTVIWFDVADKPVNVFNEEVFDDLERVLDEVEREPVDTPCLIRSGKVSGFGAGADLKRIACIESDAQVHAFLKRGQTVFNRLESLPHRIIALIEGVCLGGVLEFALAADHRIGVPSDRFQMGMPETKLGLIPGWGGTQRLPRIVGIERSLDLLIDGEALTFDQACSFGLIDATWDVTATSCSPRHVARLIESVRSRQGLQTKEQEAAFQFDAWRDAWQSRRKSSFSEAQQAVFEAVRIGCQDSIAAGLDAERNPFYALLMSPTVRTSLERFTKKPPKP